MSVFDELLCRYREFRASRAWNKSVIGKALEAHTREYFVSNPRLSAFPSAKKEKLIKEFYAQIQAVANAENSFLALREKIAEYGVAYAEMTVLSLKEEEKKKMSYSDNPYISGALHNHIERAAEHLQTLRDVKWDNPAITQEELISFCNTQGVLYAYYLNGYNLLRLEFDDWYKTKDWFQPFVYSMMIWCEDNLRAKISLPSLLPDDLGALRHSTFLNLVVNGAKNPLYEWEKQWPDLAAQRALGETPPAAGA